MSSFAARRMIASTATLVAAIFLHRYLAAAQRLSGHSSFQSGYILLIAVLILASLHWRKRLTFLPLGPVAWWLQVHLYLGLLSCFIFAQHVGWRWPNGQLETVLYIVFVATAASGIFGLVISRRLPKRLTKLREQYLYEEIPRVRRQVSEAARTIVESTLVKASSSAVVDFYRDSLVSYLERPMPLRQYLWHTSRSRNRLRNELATLKRYANADEQTVQAELARLIDRRDDLDFHDVQQTRLRLWLFLHVGLTYLLLVLAGLHIVVAHAFRGT
jgi:hypothetical protein